MAQTLHLSDTRLHELRKTDAADAHLASCAACQARLTEMNGFTSAVQAAAEAGFAEAFPEARVDASRHRILQAVERLHGPAQIVAFPGAPFAAARPRTRPRWMAAAAAGLILGLGLGRLTLLVTPAAPTRQPIATPSEATLSKATLSPVVAPVSYSLIADDELLFALETASTGPVQVLRTLHELTPLSDQPDPLW